MANTAHEQRSTQEHEFWDRRFDDDGDPRFPSIPGPSAVPHVAAAAGTEARASADDGRDALAAAARLRRPLAPEPETPWGRALEWVRDRRGDPRLGVVALVVVAVVVGFVWYRVGLSGGGEAPPAPARAQSSATTGDADRSSPVASSSASDASTSDASSRGAPLLVHVAGAVARPGVIELSKSARVIDALEAVGGATPDADVDRLNLAAPVTDGARVYVPRHGEADPGTVAPGGTLAGTGDGGSLPATVNLNTATPEQLETLPGIGPVYAQAIISERTRRGGFRSVNELREVRGIGDKRFAELAPLVTV